MNTQDVRTSEFATLISECTSGELPRDDASELIKLIGDTIGSYLARGKTVHLNKIGTFYIGVNGNIRFRPSRSLKDRYKSLVVKQRAAINQR